jgi:hypothetical protein
MKLYTVPLQFSVHVNHKLLISKEYYFLRYDTMQSIESQLIFLRNICNHLKEYTVLYPKRQYSSQLLL